MSIFVSKDVNVFAEFIFDSKLGETAHGSYVYETDHSHRLYFQERFFGDRDILYGLTVPSSVEIR
jgi:hypothetical protein